MHAARMLFSAAAAVLVCCSALCAAQGVEIEGAADAGGLGSRELLQSEETTREAYVTLLYGDDFVLGVRVLGQSLRETGTTRDLVVLSVGSALSPTATNVLKGDGWRVVPVEVVHNPAMAPRENFDGGFPQKFWAVYTKLLIFNLTDYEKVVYLDADTIVMSNVDELFTCHGFCANLKHSERFNTGVMVVEPSDHTFGDIMSKIQTMHSYTGGDQGFLNSYFEGFPDAPMFDPKHEKDPSTTHMERLPAAYNADVGLYMINSAKWMIPAKDVRIMHFTLGPFKPWNFWTEWLIDVTSHWQGFRARLPIRNQAPGLLPGETKAVLRRRHVVLVVPIVLLLAIARRYFWGGIVGALSRRGLAATGNGMSRASSLSVLMRAGGGGAPQATLRIPGRLTLEAIGVGVGSIALGGFLAGKAVPPEVFPKMGWFLTYEVIFTTFLTCFGKFLHMAYLRGRNSSDGSRGEKRDPEGGGAHHKGLGVGRPWVCTLGWAGAVMAGLVATPWMANWMAVRAITAKLGVIILMLFATTIGMTFAWIETATAWYQCGAREAEGTQRM